MILHAGENKSYSTTDLKANQISLDEVLLQDILLIVLYVLRRKWLGDQIVCGYLEGEKNEDREISIYIISLGGGERQILE